MIKVFKLIVEMKYFKTKKVITTPKKIAIRKKIPMMKPPKALSLKFVLDIFL